MKYFVRPLHFMICMMATIPWAVAMTAMTVSCALTILADRVWPRATWGNCWTHVGPRWIRGGGYLCIRASDGQRFLKVFPVPHAIWVANVDVASEIEQVAPLNHATNRWLPWYVFYFPYKVIERERRKPHSNWGRL